MQQLQKMSSVLSSRSKEYPESFQELSHPPRQISLRGNVRLLQEQPALAVIGSRKMSAYGRKMIEVLVPQLARKGVPIISGLALGCDSYAHEIALRENGKCIAVLPGSLDRIYPSSHTRLSEAILSANGLLLSEYPDGSPPPMAHHFLERNRLIAALANTVLIVEAAVRSGALTTARMALDLGRDVAAVPGSVISPLSEGTNRLLQRGAHVVCSSEDIINLLNIPPGSSTQNAARGETPEEQQILEILGREPQSVDQLVAMSTMDTSAILAAISRLEMRGIITAASDGRMTFITL